MFSSMALLYCSHGWPYAQGQGIDEIWYDAETGKTYIEISEKYFRPAEVNELLGDATKAKNELNWEPKITFQRLVEEMVDSDCQ